MYPVMGLCLTPRGSLSQLPTILYSSSFHIDTTMLMCISHILYLHISHINLHFIFTLLLALNTSPHSIFTQITYQQTYICPHSTYGAYIPHLPSLHICIQSMFVNIAYLTILCLSTLCICPYFILAHIPYHCMLAYILYSSKFHVCPHFIFVNIPYSSMFHICTHSVFAHLSCFPPFHICPPPTTCLNLIYFQTICQHPRPTSIQLPRVEFTWRTDHVV